MTRKGQATRRTDIPVDYVVSDPNGNRRSRRIAAREAKAAAKGRQTGLSSGAQGIRQEARDSDDAADEAERVIRRASLWTVWAPVLIAACAGFAAACVVAVVVALSWRPEGIGM